MQKLCKSIFHPVDYYNKIIFVGMYNYKRKLRKKKAVGHCTCTLRTCIFSTLLLDM